MQPLPIVSALESFLAGLTPSGTAGWVGASEDQIDAIEHIAGRPLPAFYRWFLRRMGGSMGSLTNPRADFSAPAVLSAYERGLFLPHPRYLSIGVDPIDIATYHVVYDLDRPIRDDARVGRRDQRGGPFHFPFETFAEQIVWGRCLAHRVEAMPQQCTGVLVDPDKDVLKKLQPLLARLGVVAPVPTGAFCGVFDSPSLAMTTWSDPDEEPEVHSFHVGAEGQSAARRTLGELSAVSGMMLEIQEWTPPMG